MSNGYYYSDSPSPPWPGQIFNSEPRDRREYQRSPYPPAMSPLSSSSAQIGSTSRNSSSRVERYQPPQRRQQPSLDPVVRPESSISNAAFRSQAPYQPPIVPMPSRSMQNARPLYVGQVAQDTTITGLGAGIANIGLGPIQPPYRTPSDKDGNDYTTLRRDSKTTGSNGSERTSKPTSASTPSSRYLAEVVKSGATEDPNDRSMSRYDTPAKLPVPSLGPARFNQSKMFSTASASAAIPDTAVTTPAPAAHAIEPRQVPDWLSPARRGEMTPTVSEAVASIPFMELFRGVSPSTTGMIRIKDIPYQTTRSEIIAFVGRNAQIARLPVGSPYHAVHIMMERETGKTMDCFVEFSNPGEASWAIRNFRRRVEQGRPPKVGDRNVEIVYASQDELLGTLFPRAKHVHWSNGQPIVDTTIRQYYPGQNAEGFKGFIHPEEFNSLIKHAGMSERSPFVSKSPCRIYEHMITTLLKFPWYAVDHITIADRRGLYDCTAALVQSLMEVLRRNNTRYSPLDPNQALLQELVVAALSCPGFSEQQKFVMVQKLNQYNFGTIAEGRTTNVKLGGHLPWSNGWPFLTLSPIPGTDPKLIEYYVKLLQRATTSNEPQSLAARMAIEAGSSTQPFANVKIDYGGSPGVLTLAQGARVEWAEVERILRKICSKSASSTPSSNSGRNFDRSVGGSGSSGSGRKTITW